MVRTELEKTDAFVFRKHDTVGAAAAEEDAQFLDECFVDTGDVATLADCKNPKRIIVGRTGTGKSALIYHLSQSCEHVFSLSPHDLSLNFIATNKVIAFFEAAGVNLTPFYVLLWKHLLVVELLRRKFKIVDEDTHRNFMSTIRPLLYKRDRYKEQAIDYLDQWGNKFWLTTEERVRELTNRVESSLSGTLGASLSSLNLSASAAKKLSAEQKREVVEHGLDAVSRIQIRELDNMIQLLADNVFDDAKERYYITIDMLDEDWADDRIKFNLIRALIDVVRRFKAVENVKIIFALRQDLLEKVTSMEPVPGFQEEKYRSLYLPLQWTKKDLGRVLELRINQLIKRRYTKGDVTFSDVFPAKIDSRDTLDYMLERTFLRPRDIIVFVNECIELAEGRTAITATIVKDAELRYSKERLKSLTDEWLTIYPNLHYTAQMFSGLKDHFEVSALTEEFIADRYNNIGAELSDANSDPITRELCSLYTSGGNFQSVRNFMIRGFYSTGLLGLKSKPSDLISWSRLFVHQSMLSAGDVRPSSIAYIHPMFHRALGISQPH